MLKQTRAIFSTLMMALAALLSCIPASTPDAGAPQTATAALSADTENDTATTTAMLSGRSTNST
jgi:hypothetical protein